MLNTLCKINKWIIGCLIIGNLVYAQNQNLQSIPILKIKLQKSIVDTTKINILNEIADIYSKQNSIPKALEYYNQSIRINKKINDNNGYAYCLTRIGEIYSKEKEYSKAVNCFSEAMKKYDKNQTVNIDNTLNQLSNVYILMSELDSKNKNKYIILSKKTLERISSKQLQYSQSVDSLKESLKKVTVDTTKINILNRIASSYFYTNPKKGIPYGEAALKLATKIQWKKGIALAYNHLGVCQWVLADYSKATTFFYKSLSVYEDLKDQNGISGAYNNLGLVNVKIKKYNQAFNYFDKAYQINKKTDNKILMVYNLNNIASIYYDQQNYTTALLYYTKSEVLNQSMFDFNGLAYNFTQIGKIYAEKKEFTKSLDYLKKALNHYDKGQTYNIGSTYIEMGITYEKMALQNSENKKQLLIQSAQNLQKAIHLFTEIDVIDKLNIAYFELYKVKKEQGNYEDALKYFEKHITIKDSLFSNESQNKLFNIQTKREIDLKDKQIEIQKLKINSDHRKVYLLITIVIFIAILFILFFWLYVAKRNTNQLLLVKNKEIVNINKQKDKFFSIIAHDLRGPFNGFLGLTELLAENIDEFSKDEIQVAALNMKSSANNLYSLLENLLEWSKMEQGLVPFSPQDNDLITAVNECVATLTDTANQKKIKINIAIPEEIKVFADNNILHAVIRNILSNAIKFTLTSGTINIQAKQTNKNVTISITDSGIGMNAEMIKNLFRIDVQTNRKGTNNEPSTGTGLGLILCKEFIEKHGGKIWVESEEEKGSTFKFSFPNKKSSVI